MPSRISLKHFVRTHFLYLQIKKERKTVSCHLTKISSVFNRMLFFSWVIVVSVGFAHSLYLSLYPEKAFGRISLSVNFILLNILFSLDNLLCYAFDAHERLLYTLSYFIIL